MTSPPPPMPPQAREAGRVSARRNWCCWTSGCRTPTASACCASGSEGHRVTCPVVILSGHGTVETAVEATRLGAADFVEKPLSLNKLLRTVEKALRGVRPGAARRRGSRGRMPPIIRGARPQPAHP